MLCSHAIGRDSMEFEHAVNCSVVAHCINLCQATDYVARPQLGGEGDTRMGRVGMWRVTYYVSPVAGNSPDPISR